MEKTNKTSLIRTKRLPLYRGKGKYSGEWIYGNLIQNCNGEYIVSEQDSVKVEFNTVGRETFKTDKNGYDIYEDDILKCECLDGRGNLIRTVYLLVYWDTAAAGFKLKCSDCAEPDDMDCMNDCEIVGNINDNLEYLKLFEVTA